MAIMDYIDHNLVHGPPTPPDPPDSPDDSTTPLDQQQLQEYSTILDYCFTIYFYQKLSLRSSNLTTYTYK